MNASELVPTFTARQPDPIAESLGIPPEELSNRILFIVIDSLAPANFDTKVQEMYEQFVDKYSQ